MDAYRILKACKSLQRLDVFNAMTHAIDTPFEIDEFMDFFMSLDDLQYASDRHFKRYIPDDFEAFYDM